MSDKRRNRNNFAFTPLKAIFLLFVILAEIGILVLVLHHHSSQPESVSPTPVLEELTEPTPLPVDYSADAAALSISEVMAKNTATLLADDGTFPDWIELTNTSDHSINLKGWSLSDGK